MEESRIVLNFFHLSKLVFSYRQQSVKTRTNKNINKARRPSIMAGNRKSKVETDNLKLVYFQMTLIEQSIFLKLAQNSEQPIALVLLHTFLHAP
jgi:hypothetical protein